MLRQSLDCPIKSGNDIYDGNRAIFSFDPRIKVVNVNEIAEKEMQDTSCRGSGGIPQL
ncbi:MAG TPA: hypothetical protein VMX96_02805 [Dehalococcoidia bacterium]|nr:hypothetical protein [Dehalococcoidia bacterium]